MKFLVRKFCLFAFFIPVVGAQSEDLFPPGATRVDLDF
jgi:hypothetical protein